ncbi:MAG: hypothetical protein M9962_12630 [Oligoflexia bacterium]|nr:hypothetical protein [Oligoflexia bacterium]
MKKRAYRGFTLSFLVFLLCFSCGKEKENVADIRASAPAERHAPLEGSPRAELTKIHESKWLESCDLKFKDKQMEIVIALEDRQDSINRYNSLLANSSLVVNVSSNDKKIKTVGPLTIIQLENGNKKGWVDDVFGWQEIIDRYEKIKNNTVTEDWYYLDRSVKSIITSDKNRILYGANVFIKKGDEAILTKMSNEFFGCGEELNCIADKFNKYKDFINQQPYYDLYREAFLASSDLDKKKNYRDRFFKRLNWDLIDFGFTKNSNVKWSGKNLTLSLDSFELYEIEAYLKNYIETYWKNEDSMVLVEWKSSNLDKDIFKFKRPSSDISRSFVRRSDEVIQLASIIRSSTIIHELGHVLGFSDSYYEVWDPKKCTYTQQSTDTDIMSGGSENTVTKEHFDRLRLEYP